MIAYIEVYFSPLGAVDSLGYIFDLINIRQAADESIVTLKAQFLRVFASLKMGGISIDSALQAGFMLCILWLGYQAVVQEFHLGRHSLTAASLQTVVECMSYDKDFWKGPVGCDGKPARTPLAKATTSDPDNSLYTGMAAKPFNFHIVVDSRLFCTTRTNASSVSTLLRTTPTTRCMTAPS